MKKRSNGVTVLAVIFLVLGLVWAMTVQQRVKKIAPNPVPSSSVERRSCC